MIEWSCNLEKLAQRRFRIKKWKRDALKFIVVCRTYRLTLRMIQEYIYEGKGRKRIAGKKTYCPSGVTSRPKQCELSSDQGKDCWGGAERVEEVRWKDMNHPLHSAYYHLANCKTWRWTIFTRCYHTRSNLLLQCAETSTDCRKGINREAGRSRPINN